MSKNDIAVMMKYEENKKEAGYQLFLGDSNNPVNPAKMPQKDVQYILNFITAIYKDIENKYQNLCQVCKKHCPPEIGLVTFGENKNVTLCMNYIGLPDNSEILRGYHG